MGGVVTDAAGNFYGTTAYGGANGYGTVFMVNAAGAETVLQNFSGGNDGGVPNGGLVIDKQGNLYGTTSAGGVVNNNCFQGCGVVFSLSPTSAGAWHETVLDAFNGNDGSQPQSPLLLDLSQPALYGTTNAGRDYNCTTIAAGTSCGVVFKITR